MIFHCSCRQKLDLKSMHNDSTISLRPVAVQPTEQVSQPSVSANGTQTYYPSKSMNSDSLQRRQELLDIFNLSFSTKKLP